jgi:hypothetical protein
MFGVNEQGETCGVFVSDYRPFFYVLVKDDWSIARKNEFILHIKYIIRNKYYITNLAELRRIILSIKEKKSYLGFIIGFIS